MAKVFDTVMVTSSGPDVKSFQMFREYWCSVDHSSYETGLDVEFITLSLNPVQDYIICFIR